MNAVVFETESWMGKQQFLCTGETAADVLAKFGQVQDLWCLLRMGRVKEPAAGQKQLDILENVLYKYESGALELSDLAQIQVRLSIGTLNCLAAASDAQYVSMLTERFPKARKI